jgi:hypothetical protein
VVEAVDHDPQRKRDQEGDKGDPSDEANQRGAERMKGRPAIVPVGILELVGFRERV